MRAPLLLQNGCAPWWMENKMKLTFEQIKEITRGVARVEKVGNKVCLYRFTKAQEEMYRERQADFHRKSFATAGVILEFDTDSENLGLSVEVTGGSSRKFFTHSIFDNGQRIGELAGEFKEGETVLHLRGAYSLNPGKKRVKILFPWSAASKICELTLDDGSEIIPVEKNRKVLLFGDSITHGYDARKPENSYASRLAQWLDADGINKAIGGEVFCPALADLPEDFIPDLITVAYGTNDWSKRPREDFEKDSFAFFRNLRKHYPNTKIVAMAPIWRADTHLQKPIGPFGEVAKHLAKIAGEIENVTFIDCWDFVPQNSGYFSDRYLHPNDEGFCFYAQALLKKLDELGVR